MGRKRGKGMGAKRKDVKGKAWWGKGGGEGNRSGRGNRMRVQEREGKLVKTGGGGLGEGHHDAEREGVIAEVLGERKHWMGKRGEC